MTNVNFKITTLNDSSSIWSATQDTFTSCADTARKALSDGHRVQAFAGRQQRRITNTKAGIA